MARLEAPPQSSPGTPTPSVAAASVDSAGHTHQEGAIKAATSAAVDDDYTYSVGAGHDIDEGYAFGPPGGTCPAVSSPSNLFPTAARGTALTRGT